jgi:hypothetical protein
VVSQTFEDWRTEAHAFSLVFSAQAFHWIPPDVRFTKAAAVLQPGGALAVLGNAVVSDESPLRKALDDAYAHHAPSMTGPPATRWYAAEGPIQGLFAESGCFGPASWRRYPWSRVYETRDYLALLRTHSDHRLLPPEQRETLERAVAHVIESHGGTIKVAYEANLYLGARAA